MASFDTQDTFAKIQAIVANKLNIAPEAVTEKSTLQDLGADSLDMVEIIMKLEEQFAIEINDADAEKLTNVRDVVQYVHNLRTK